MTRTPPNTNRFSRVGLFDWIVAASSCGFVASWLVALVIGRVPLDYLGDEAGRILFSYEVSTPRSLGSYLLSSEAWVQIHPPGDAAFKGLLNWVAEAVVSSSAGFVDVHRIVGWLCVVGGLVLIGLGVGRRFGGRAAIVFGGLAVTSTPVVYVAHHALGENLATLLVGFAVFRVLTRPMTRPQDAILSAAPLAVAAVVRPEAALVFASLALIPLWERRWRSAFLFASVSVLPVGLISALIELTSDAESYASIRRFPRVAFFDVVIDERMREIIWGMGVVPFLGIAVVLVAAYASLRRSLTLGVLLTAGWMVWALLFTSQIAVGAIHRQERAYLFPALLGLVAIAALGSDWLNRLGRGSSAVVASILLVLVGFNAYGLWSQTYRSWQIRVPRESVEVSDWLQERASPDDAILLDWMWWQEWRAAVYASKPGLPGPYCVYYRCLADPDPALVAGLALPETEIARQRLVLAASFLRDKKPRQVVMLTQERYDDWLSEGPGREYLPSFVRPLLQADGDCYRTLDVLGGKRYCPVFENASYVILELVE